MKFKVTKEHQKGGENKEKKHRQKQKTKAKVRKSPGQKAKGEKEKGRGKLHFYTFGPLLGDFALASICIMQITSS